MIRFNSPPDIAIYRVPESYSETRVVFYDGKEYVEIGDEEQYGWMDNTNSYESGVGGLISQYRNASGRILIGGLGLGLLALALDRKPEVTEIVVVEKNPDIILLFNINNWEYSKIKIINEDILVYTDTAPYDWVLLDHVNYEQNILGKLVEDINTVSSNVISKNYDIFLWERLYLESNLPWQEFRALLKLPYYSEEELNLYINNYNLNGDTDESWGILNILSSVKHKG